MSEQLERRVEQLERELTELKQILSNVIRNEEIKLSMRRGEFDPVGAQEAATAARSS